MKHLLWMMLCTLRAASVAGDGGVSGTNVIFIMVDDLKPVLGSYGDSVADTPHMDKLIAKGLRLDNAHSQKSECAPSRASVLTGMRNDALRVWNFNEDFRKLNPKVHTFPGWLREQGYATEAIGKVWDNRYFPRGGPPADLCESPSSKFCSFDNVVLSNSFFEEGSTACEGHGAFRWPSGKFTNDDKFPTLIYEFDDKLDEYHSDYCTRVVASERLIDLASKEKPFFLAVGFNKPHMPWVAPKRDFDKFRVVPTHVMEPPPIYHTGSEIISDAKDFWSETNPGTQPQDNGELESYEDFRNWTFSDRTRAYYAATRFVDTQIGELVKVLEEQVDDQVSNNTMIVLWGDHGFHLGDANLWGKKTLLEHSTRVPCAVIPSQAFLDTNPDIDIGNLVSEAPVDSVDLFPTVLDMADLPEPTNFPLAGTSLTPLFRDPSSSVRSASVSQYETYKDSTMSYSVRSTYYRLIVRLSINLRSGEIDDNTNPRLLDGELYYYPTPGNYETINLFDHPDHARAQQALLDLVKTTRNGNPDPNWTHLIQTGKQTPFDLNDVQVD